MHPQGDYIGYIGAFLGGVVVSFSPCVYPLLPITLAFIGVEAGLSRLKGFLLSLVYVFGLAITYSALGLVAALSGSLFGRISTHPLSYFVIANACIIWGLSFLDVININFFGLSLQNKIKTRGGFFSAFLLGLVSGLAVGPCVAPALGTILVYAASKQNIIYGASLLFVFAYGMGFLLILAGTFSAASFSLRSGARATMSSRISSLIGNSSLICIPGEAVAIGP